MAKAYVATAALVQTHGPDGVDRHFYQDAPIPADVVTKEHLKMLLDAGMIAEAEAEPAASEDDGEWNGPKGVKIDDVLAYVGDDAEVAAEVLTQEQAGDNRATLVKALEKITDPAAD